MLRAFEASARTGSMRRAADDLGVAHSVISRHVAGLEAWIGAKLIIAGPRGVHLTREGELYFAKVTKAFDLITAATAELKPPTRRGFLRIWCVPGLAARWLTPRLLELQSVVRGSELTLRAIDRLPDFERSEADLMIGFGDLTTMPPDTLPLIRPRMFPVASPEWLALNKMPKLADLARLPLIHEENHRQWENWLRAAGVASDRPLVGPRLWDANLGFDAAMTGQGIALVSRLTASEYIDDGRLVELFDTDIRLGGYYLTVAPSRRSGRDTLALRQWLMSNLDTTEKGST
nr:LysR substrate-binding domain-containing protein [Bradyrhizobium diazoefficiens]